MIEKTTSLQEVTSEILETQADDLILWEFVAEKWLKRIQNAWFFGWCTLLGLNMGLQPYKRILLGFFCLKTPSNPIDTNKCYAL